MNTLLKSVLCTFFALTSQIAMAQKAMEPSKVVQALLPDSSKTFFNTAASAGMFEIEAGKLAQSMGTSAEIKTFGEQMVIDHTNAAAELKAIADKKGVTLPETMLKHHEMKFNGLKKEAAGKSFDNEYRLKMILSHKAAVSLFAEATTDTEDADIKAFATKTLPTPKHDGGMAKDLPKTQ